MKKRHIATFISIGLLCLVTGVLVWQLISAEQAKISQINQPQLTSLKEPPKQQELDTTPEQAISALSTAKEGWGFVRNKNHETPQISKHQRSLLAKYPAVFTINTKAKQVVLTFDLGYENGYTPRILDTLKAHHIPATFFVTGPWLKENPELGKRILAEGHILGNHTMSHPSLPELDRASFDQELDRLDQRIIETTRITQNARFLRPPKGEYSERTLQWAKEKGYTTVFWSIALLDWKPLPSPQVVVQGVMNNLHPGAVILLHGVSKEVTNGLDQLLKEMAVEGYRVIPLDKVKI